MTSLVPTIRVGKSLSHREGGRSELHIFSPIFRKLNRNPMVPYRKKGNGIYSKQLGLRLLFLPSGFSPELSNKLSKDDIQFSGHKIAKFSHKTVSHCNLCYTRMNRKIVLLICGLIGNRSSCDVGGWIGDW